MTTMDICFDCEGPGIYPNGTPCKSCDGSGLVAKGERTAMPSLSPLDLTEGQIEAACNAYDEQLSKPRHWAPLSVVKRECILAAITAALRALPQEDAAEKPKGGLAEQVWTEFVAACEEIEERAWAKLEKPNCSEHAEGFARGERHAAKSIRRQIVHPKYRLSNGIEDGTP